MLGSLYDAFGAIENKLFPKKEAEPTRWEKQVLKSHHAAQWRLATSDYDSRLINTLNEVHKAYGIKKEPRIFIYKNEHGYSASYESKSTTYFINERKLLEYSDAELKAVLGHEVAHHKQRNFLLARNWLRIGAQVGVTAFATHFLMKNLGKPLRNLAGKVEHDWSQKTLQRSANFIESSLIFGGTTFMLLWQNVASVLKYPFNTITRFFERDADKKATHYIREPGAQITSLNKNQAHWDKDDKEWDKKYGKPIAPSDPDKAHLVKDELPKREKSKEPEGWRKILNDAKRTHPENIEREKLIRQNAKEEGIQIS